MTSSIKQREPILDYPSRESVMDLVVALVEKSSGIAMPEGWPENESRYFLDDDATRFQEFRDAIDGAINGAEPADWLLRELKDFERTIAETAFEDIQATPVGQDTLEAIRAAAVARFRAEQDQQEGQSDDNG